MYNFFGGGIGLPIVKDKTFFQGNVEFLRQRTGTPTTFTGITQDFFNFVQSGNYQKYMEGTAFQNAATIPDPNVIVNGQPIQIDGKGFCPENFGTTCVGKFADVATLGPVFSKIYNSKPSSYPFATRNFTNIPTDLLLGDTEYLPVNIYGDGSVTETTPTNISRGSAKLDHKLSARDQLAFTYAVEIDSTNDNIAGGAATPGPGEVNFGGAQIFGARYSHEFTPNLLNDFRAGYLRHVRNFVSAGAPGIAATFVADTPTTGFGATPGFPQFFTENQFSYEDAVTFSHGKHTPKAGFRFIRTRNGSAFYNDVNGTIGFWGSPGLLTDGLNEVDGLRLLDGGTTGPYHSYYGTLFEATASQDPTTGRAPNPNRGYRANEFAAYLQDDWKASPRLLLSYGLRWEYFGPPHNAVAGLDSNVYFGNDTAVKTTNPFAPNVPLLLGEQGAQFECVGVGTPCGTFAPGSGTTTIWNRDLNNFAPRLGFAYDTFGTGKFVIRGGASVSAMTGCSTTFTKTSASTDRSSWTTRPDTPLAPRASAKPSACRPGAGNPSRATAC